VQGFLDFFNKNLFFYHKYLVALCRKTIKKLGGIEKQKDN
jgi:hypothetical protein